MRLLRNMFTAIVIGVIGGMAVSVVSYYNQHKDGGLKQTLMAVANSFQTVAKTYQTDEVDALPLAADAGELGETLSGENGMALGKNVLAAFGELFSQNNNTDVLAVNDSINEKIPYGDIMRFHVRANSDTDEDQELKMEVKDEVVSMLKPLLRDCENVAQSKETILANLQNIYKTAVDTIVEQGYDYPVKVYVTTEEFPAKTYGDLTFPEGTYQALRVDIGEAEGQNWWCVMYPPLCFIDETTTVVSEEGKEILKENLTQKEYQDLFAHSDIKVESWLYNLLIGE